MLPENNQSSTYSQITVQIYLSQALARTSSCVLTRVPQIFSVQPLTWLKSWGAGVVSSSITVSNELWMSSKCCWWSGWLLMRYSLNCHAKHLTFIIDSISQRVASHILNELKFSKLPECDKFVLQCISICWSHSCQILHVEVKRIISISNKQIDTFAHSGLVSEVSAPIPGTAGDLSHKSLIYWSWVCNSGAVSISPFWCKVSNLNIRPLHITVKCDGQTPSLSKIKSCFLIANYLVDLNHTIV